MLSFTVQVAGVTKGTIPGSRQRVLDYARQQGLRSVTLKREPDNPADENAIAVLIKARIGNDVVDVKVGYIPNRAKCLVCDPQQKGHGIASYEAKHDGFICQWQRKGPNGQKLFDENGQPVICGGRMDPGTADKIVGYFDSGAHVDGRIVRFVGGAGDKKTLGMTIEVNIETGDDQWA